MGSAWHGREETEADRQKWRLADRDLLIRAGMAEDIARGSNLYKVAGVWRMRFAADAMTPQISEMLISAK